MRFSIKGKKICQMFKKFHENQNWEDTKCEMQQRVAAFKWKKNNNKEWLENATKVSIKCILHDIKKYHSSLMFHSTWALDEKSQSAQEQCRLFKKIKICTQKLNLVLHAFIVLKLLCESIKSLFKISGPNADHARYKIYLFIVQYSQNH